MISIKDILIVAFFFYSCNVDRKEKTTIEISQETLLEPIGYKCDLPDSILVHLISKIDSLELKVRTEKIGLLRKQKLTNMLQKDDLLSKNLRYCNYGLKVCYSNDDKCRILQVIVYSDAKTANRVFEIMKNSLNVSLYEKTLSDFFIVGNTIFLMEYLYYNDDKSGIFIDNMAKLFFKSSAKHSWNRESFIRNLK